MTPPAGAAAEEAAAKIWEVAAGAASTGIAAVDTATSAVGTAAAKTGEAAADVASTGIAAVDTATSAVGTAAAKTGEAAADVASTGIAAVDTATSAVGTAASKTGEAATGVASTGIAAVDTATSAVGTAAAKTGEAAADVASTGIAAVDTATSAVGTAASKTGEAATGVASASGEVPIATPIFLPAPAKSKPADVVDDSEVGCLRKGVVLQDSLLPVPVQWTSSAAECQQKCLASKGCSLFTWKKNTKPTGGCWLFPEPAAPMAQMADPNATSGAKDCSSRGAVGLAQGPAKSFIAQSPSGMNSNTLWAVLGGVAVAAAVAGVAAFASSSSEAKKGKRGLKIAAHDEESATSIAPSPVYPGFAELETCWFTPPISVISLYKCLICLYYSITIVYHVSWFGPSPIWGHQNPWFYIASMHFDLPNYHSFFLEASCQSKVCSSLC